MGVPAFYKWLVRKFPKIVRDVVEEDPTEINGVTIWPDTSKPNPNGAEFDNLYLDMNGIIHPACHPESGPQPKSEEEMIHNTFGIVDRMFSIVRPRKFLFLAIDGVAPRAKMNQQRSRRFRAAHDSMMKRKEELKLRQEWEESGRGHLLPPLAPESWDSNVITPGTTFMDKVAKGLRYYTAMKLNTDPGWKGVKVLISDSNTPGEGEHKIMEYIRKTRLQENYDPLTKHVICGLDADLIHLALATHELNFTILREVVQPPSTRRCFICGQTGHIAADCEGEAKQRSGKFDEKSSADEVEDPTYQFLDIRCLREYLEHTLYVPNMRIPWDVERAIDDFVFLCFFVGNDFLPHLPSLDIREHAIDKLMDLYKGLLPSVDGYLTCNGDVDLALCELFVKKLGGMEDEVFRRRAQREVDMKRRKDMKSAMNAARKRELDGSSSANASALPVTSFGAPPHTHRPQQSQQSNVVMYKADGMGFVDGVQVQVQRPSNRAAAQALKRKIMFGGEGEGEKKVETEKKEEKEKEDDDEDYRVKRIRSGDVRDVAEAAGQIQLEDKSRSMSDVGEGVSMSVIGDASTPSTSTPVSMSDVGEKSVEKEEIETTDFEIALKSSLKVKETKLMGGEEKEDKIRLGTDGWKDRYYAAKFKMALDDAEFVPFVTDLVHAYVSGLIWTYKYYYQGVASWVWYYPYHYAPFASDLDFVRVSTLEFKFDLGDPFKPFDQLMAVLPRRSSHCLPLCYAELMSPDSPIKHFYPDDFPIDMSDAKFAWQGVSLLPFIDERELKSAISSVESMLSEDEIERNTLKESEVFCRRDDNLGKVIDGLYLLDIPTIEDVRGKGGSEGENKLKIKSRIPISWLKHGLSGFISKLANGVCTSRQVIPQQLLIDYNRDLYTPINPPHMVVSSEYTFPIAATSITPHLLPIPQHILAERVLSWADVRMLQEVEMKHGRNVTVDLPNVQLRGVGVGFVPNMNGNGNGRGRGRGRGMGRGMGMSRGSFAPNQMPNPMMYQQQQQQQQRQFKPPHSHSYPPPVTATATTTAPAAPDLSPYGAAGHAIGSIPPSHGGQYPHPYPYQHPQQHQYQQSQPMRMPPPPYAPTYGREREREGDREGEPSTFSRPPVRDHHQYQPPAVQPVWGQYTQPRQNQQQHQQQHRNYGSSSSSREGRGGIGGGYGGMQFDYDADYDRGRERGGRGGRGRRY